MYCWHVSSTKENDFRWKATAHQCQRVQQTKEYFSCFQEEPCRSIVCGVKKGFCHWIAAKISSLFANWIFVFGPNSVYLIRARTWSQTRLRWFYPLWGRASCSAASAIDNLKTGWRQSVFGDVCLCTDVYSEGSCSVYPSLSTCRSMLLSRLLSEHFSSHHQDRLRLECEQIEPLTWRRLVSEGKFIPSPKPLRWILCSVLSWWRWDYAICLRLGFYSTSLHFLMPFRFCTELLWLQVTSRKNKRLHYHKQPHKIHCQDCDLSGSSRVCFLALLPQSVNDAVEDFKVSVHVMIHPAAWPV